VRRFADGSKPMGVMMIDVRYFKKVNDTYSHSVGDDVLRAIANRLAGSVRAVDVVARWGGEDSSPSCRMRLPDHAGDRRAACARRWRHRR